ncbi:C40 family peptidase [Corynebacterium callunae]|uniref:Cell wall-associated hydrolase n=1 Tax=Corynebacterium callunae DSM 20147 TaxID=1121353 RepID=M1USI4_9CORY|nr:C40 family peptidase [Corynebacterium callunae]AGG66082.1 cell wall-associated hydrolase [Corynebacterium callunae DSM 20147]
MIDLLSTVRFLASQEPASMPELNIPKVPEITTALELGAELQANPLKLTQLVEILDVQRSLLINTLREVAPIINATRQELSQLAQDFIRQGIELFMQSLIPNPAVAIAAQMQLMQLPGVFIDHASLRLNEMTQTLQPYVDKLSTITPVAEPRLAEVPAPTSGAASAGERAVAAAKTALGAPYLWGGTSLNGFDCSGFTQWAWRAAGLELPRTAEQQAVGTQVSADQLQPGDLAVWDGHVAMYAGNGELIEAGDPVQLNPLRTSNMGMTFQGFFRPTG